MYCMQCEVLALAFLLTIVLYLEDIKKKFKLKKYNFNSLSGFILVSNCL